MIRTHRDSGFTSEFNATSFCLLGDFYLFEVLFIFFWYYQGSSNAKG
ncbi:hypothetical protein Hdeb2414_s1177g00989471 [Helianthus debilis subsp. tardiflorus]